MEDAEILGVYTDDFYAGQAALTRKRFGKGAAYYMAARTSAGEMRPLFGRMLADADIAVRKLPAGVEYHMRTGEEGAYEFYLNCSMEPATLTEVRGVDLITGNAVSGGLKLDGCGVAVVKL